MKFLIAGSRTLQVAHPVSFLKCLTATYAPVHITEIVHGGCPTGPDKWADQYAKYYEHVVTVFPAEWGKLGTAAGPIRNREMAHYADALLIIWDGQSKGSANMRAEMMRLHKPVYEICMRIVAKAKEEG